MPLPALRAIVAVLVVLGTVTLSCAQSTDEEIVYRFEVTGIDDQASAKMIVHALSENASVTYCTFIPECRCFKLGCRVTLSFEMLDGMVRRHGHHLSEGVHGSDGSFLLPANTPSR